jgi:hypothetical protein
MKGLTMTRTLLATTLLALAAGCFGSDPNKNSILFNPEAGVPGQTGGAGTSGGGNATGPIVGSPIATFDTTTEGFQLNVYHDTSATNLADPAVGADPTFTFDATDGSPSPGCLKVVAPYTGPNQYVDIQKSMTTSPQDWHGRTLHVRIKVADGTFPGGAQVYVITVPNKYYFGGTYTNVVKGNNWQEFTVNIDNPGSPPPAGYDPTQVIIVGVQLPSGSAAAAVTTTTFLIDSFSLDPPLSGTGGGGAGGATGAAGAGGAAGATGGAGGRGGAGGAAGGTAGAAGGGGGRGGAGGAAGGNADASATG